MDDTTPTPPAPPGKARAESIDYQAAAERLLVALSSIAVRSSAFRRPSTVHPIPAVKLCRLAFDRDVWIHWKRETVRRRIRDTVEVARTILHQKCLDASVPPCLSASVPQCLRASVPQCLITSVPDPRPPTILAANGRGYWMTGDPQIITWYAAQRRRHGLTALAAASQAKQTLTTAQPSLFQEVVPTPSSAVMRASCPPPVVSGLPMSPVVQTPEITSCVW